MKLPDRKFTDDWAKAGKRFLGIAINGFSGAGKTFSALRLAMGIARAIAKILGLKEEDVPVYGIDADSGRMSHYDKYFKFRVVNLPPPHGALHFLAAIEHCVSKGARVIVIDHLTAEHTGDGGLLDQMETYLEEKAGDNYGKRQAYQMLSMKKPKEERKAMNRRILGLVDVVFILCFRAADKVKPRKKGEVVPDGEEKIQHIGWQAETTNPIFWEMTVRFLLMPGSDGKPKLQPETVAEKMSVKMPEQFKAWFKDGFQLDEAMGEKLGRWHMGLDEEGNGPKSAETPKAAPAAQAAPAAGNAHASPPNARVKQLAKWLNESNSTIQCQNRWSQLAQEPSEVLAGLLDTCHAKLAELEEAKL